MPTAHLDQVDIYYEVIGLEGPFVAVIQGGRHPLGVMKDLPRAIAARGYRVLMHDRRNCGRSSLNFDSSGSEEDVWVDDLTALLTNLKIPQVFMVGQSRGARIALQFALRYPEVTRGLLLWGISGGEAVARVLDNYYYGKYLRACETGGMAAVCALDHFEGLAAARPENKDWLLSLDPFRFMSVMSGWRTHFLAGVQQPVMGLSDDQLRGVSVPTAIVPYYDRMHPYATAAHARAMIPGSRLFDFDPTRRGDRTIATDDAATVAAIAADFERSLPPRDASGGSGSSRSMRPS